MSGLINGMNPSFGENFMACRLTFTTRKPSGESVVFGIWKKIGKPKELAVD